MPLIQGEESSDLHPSFRMLAVIHAGKRSAANSGLAAIISRQSIPDPQTYPQSPPPRYPERRARTFRRGDYDEAFGQFAVFQASPKCAQWRPFLAAAAAPARGHAMKKAGLATLLCVTLLAVAAPAGAEDVADFFRGKTVRIVVGVGVGSGYDLNARLLARYLPNHIPGHPAVIVQNQPGAGSLTMMSLEG
jgi:hypothetical protein